MFIYFPEYFYKNTLNYLKSTFRNNLDGNNYKANEIISKEINGNNDLKQIFKDFKDNKIKLPTLQLEHCIPKLFVNQSESLDINSISNYNSIENTIKICKNKIESDDEFVLLFRKELSYAYDMNLKFKNKGSYTLQDYSKMSTNACTNMIKNIKGSHKLIKNELIRRCSYLELKYKFGNEIKLFYEDEYPSMEDLKLNNIVKNLIDKNII
jgi:hypothetical protein